LPIHILTQHFGDSARQPDDEIVINYSMRHFVGKGSCLNKM
jgi:hypothetical protein